MVLDLFTFDRLYNLSFPWYSFYLINIDPSTITIFFSVLKKQAHTDEMKKGTCTSLKKKDSIEKYLVPLG